ncbi:MAG: glycosyltransferase [Candidatus Omnitrophota bacterium]
MRINTAAESTGIKVFGPRGYDETDRLISGAKLLVSTAEFEGISNTFLQAWRRGIPVVSFVDPDEIIAKNDLGIVVKSFEDLVTAVERLRKGISDDDSRKIKEFFDRTFTTEIIARRFDELVRDIFQETQIKRIGDE